MVSLHRHAVAHHLARSRIERDAVHLDAPAGRLAVGPPQNRPDPRHQFARVERLGQIIVGAQFEAHDAVHVLAPRGQHEHGNAALLPHALQDLETVHARQHDVEDDQVEAALDGRRKSRTSIVLELYGIALALQEFTEQCAQFDVVVDYKQPHAIKLARAPEHASKEL